MDNEDNMYLKTVGLPLPPKSGLGGFIIMKMWAVARDNEDKTEYLNALGLWGEYGPDVLFFESSAQANTFARSYIDYEEETKKITKSSVLEFPSREDK